MISFTAITNLIFLGGLVICLGGQTTSQEKRQIDNGSFQNSEYSYSKPKFGPDPSIYNNGYQYSPPNNGAGYHYKNPSQVQNTDGLDFGSHVLEKNKKKPFNSGYPTSSEYVSSPIQGSNMEHFQRHFSDIGYHYDTPHTHYGNFKSTANLNNPKQSTSFHSNFKGSSYLPSSNNDFQYAQQQGFLEQNYASVVDGYNYESPKHSGYNYNKPQQFGQAASGFKGPSYLPSPTSLVSSSQNEGFSHGYAYEKPSTVAFKGSPYLPNPPVSSGW
ncbi:uncharacterized protein LOC129916550 [Episyrphus balteatus]|uniref:uncharacterized protein LOC129916550 n=1 Tax=Episyrphus balteatus TaxID=286459 RepID=UPI002484F45B|nr:uncharacterized protein LOC129916550 [Episyrphus balteatus]